MSELHYVVEGRPASWQRTNLVNGRAVTAAGQRSAKRAHAWAAIAALRAAGSEWPQDGRYEVEVVAYYPDGRQGDTDRVVSLPLDAMQGVLYRDDRQVVRVVGERRTDKARPRVEVTVRRLEEA